MIIKMRHLKRINEESPNENINWIKIGEGNPKKDTNYLVTIYKRGTSGERVVTIGSYNYNPFSKNYEWTHEYRMLAYAELPNPFQE